MSTCPIRTQPGHILGYRYDGRPIFPIAGGAPDPEPEPKPDPQPQPDPAPQPDPEPAPKAEKVEDLPAWAQKIIADARKDAGDNRAAKKAAEEQVQAILKAAGVKADEDDPAKQLEAERKAKADLAAENATIRRERAAEKAGRKHGADVDELMDRSSFLTALGKLDPSSDSFTSELDALVKKTLEDNPKLKTGRAPGASSVDNPGGTGERRSDKPKSLTDAVAASYGV